MKQPNYVVSDDSLNKVERFFREASEAAIGNIITAKVADIALASGVAVATCHKAIKELEKRGVIQIKKKSDSRREALQYIYTGAKPRKNKDELEQLVKQLQNEVFDLKAKLAAYEEEYKNVQVFTSADASMKIVVKQRE